MKKIFRIALPIVAVGGLGLVVYKAVQELSMAVTYATLFGLPASRSK